MTVESVLHYGCETWTIQRTRDKEKHKSLGRMLHKNVEDSHECELETTHDKQRTVWWVGGIPYITSKITTSILRFAGHCKRAKECPVSKLVTWQPTQGRRTQGRPMKTYVDLLQDDTGYQTNEIETTMNDRRLWRAIINARQQESTE